MGVLDVAIREVGTKESPRNSNNVKYNTWFYGHAVQGDDYPWCMAFVQWVFAQAGSPLPYKTAGCSSLLDWYKENAPASVFKTPQVGDIVIYTFGHTGIVEAIGDRIITAIEGNTSIGNDSNGGEVMRRTREASRVLAYIRPEIKEEEKMTYEDFKKFMDKWLTERSEKTAPAWAKDELQKAMDAGITDGSDPMTFVPRYQAALMAYRAFKFAKGEDTNE